MVSTMHKNFKPSFPMQAEVWLLDPDPLHDSDIGKRVRPCVVISCNLLNTGASGCVIVVPISSVHNGIPSRIQLDPPDGGLTKVCYAVPEQIRSVSRDRLIRRCGILESREVFREIVAWIYDFIKFG